MLYCQTSIAENQTIGKISHFKFLTWYGSFRQHSHLCGRSSTWFDSLGLPDKKYPYITPIRLTRWYSANHPIIEAVVPIFGAQHSKYTLYLTAYDLRAYILSDRPYWESHLLEPQDLIRYPQILNS